MNTLTTKRIIRGTALGAVLALATALAAAPKEDAPGDNRLVLSGGGAWVDGDAAAFQERHQFARKGFGGIEDLFYSRDTGNGTLTLKARALAGNNDYLFDLHYAHNEKGYFRAGYREFRIWYDSSGDVVPQALNDPGGLAFVGVGDEIRATDRSEAWLEGLFQPSEDLDLHFRYSHRERNGTKESTTRGDTQLAGSLGDKRIVGAFWDLDETSDTIEADATMRHDGGEVTAALRYEERDLNNARKIHRRPGEPEERLVTHRELNSSELFNVRAFATHRYNEKLFLSAAYSRSKIDSVLGGSRIYGSRYDAIYDPAFVRRQRRDEGFIDLVGNSWIRQDVGTIALMFTPDEHWVIAPSFRAERERRESMAEFIETNWNPVNTVIQEDLETTSHRKWEEWTFGLEARYTGIADWVLTARTEFSDGDGDLAEDELDLHTNSVVISRDTAFDRSIDKHGLTANWYPSTRANFSLIYTLKNRRVDYAHAADSTDNTVTSGNRFPAFVQSQDFETDDFAFRMTLRPGRGVTLVTRYDYQMTDIVSREVGLGTINSAAMTSKILSQSISLQPVPRMFIQGMLNHVSDVVDTPANTLTGGAANLVLDSENDYWSAALTIGLALDDQTDAYLRYNHFFADNFVDNSADGVPYGLTREDRSLSVTCVHRLNERTRFSLKYAWARNDEDSSLGFDDYDAHLIYGRFEYRF